MDAEEIYAERVAKSRTYACYESLTDIAEDIAYDELTEYIQDAMPQTDAQDYLIKIATIWQQKGTTAEKYGLIGDIFQRIVDSNAENKMKGF